MAKYSEITVLTDKQLDRYLPRFIFKCDIDIKMHAQIQSYITERQHPI